jgi:GDPmannose 4,6-dehydratase
LICGITGQDGGFLAELLLSKHYDVFGTSRRDRDQFNNSFIPPHIKSQIHLPSADLTDFNTVNDLVKTIHPDEIYNLSGLSSVGLSFEQPIEAMRSIAESTLNVLEVIHKAHSPARFYNAGSTECFGDTQAQAPADENTALRPRSPYGVAKAAAMMHVANYREAYGVFASSGILSNHESLRRPQSFVIHKVVSAAVAIAQGRHQRLVLGNMEIVRD